MNGFVPTPSAAPCAAVHAPGDGKGGGPQLAAVLALLILAACAPDLGDTPLPADPSGFATTTSFAAPATDWPQDAWWKTYGDPQLDALITEALEHAPSLRIAAARLRAAQAEAQVAGADLWPTVTASGNLAEAEVSRNQMGKEQRSFMPRGWHHQAQIAAGISYELDFFGKNRAALAAATSSAQAAAADEAAARLQLSTAVATTYAQLVQLHADQKLALEAVRQREESASLVKQRFTSQLENKSALAQAEAQIWAARTNADTVARLITLTRNELAALLGKGPDRGRSITATDSKLTLRTAGLPQNLSLALVGRRPDIVAAKERAEAAASAIDVANANFYPNIDLVGQFGVQSLDAKYLLTATSEFGQFGPAITLPIFDYGRLSGQYRKSRADYDAAVASYDQTLSDALRDVANAYSNRKSVEDELAHARASLRASEEAYRVIRTRYKAGLARYIEVLTAETALIDQRRTVADFETGAFAYDIALVRALGGGYSHDTAQVSLQSRPIPATGKTAVTEH